MKNNLHQFINLNDLKKIFIKFRVYFLILSSKLVPLSWIIELIYIKINVKK
jgi:hypothetical protein